MNLNDDWPEIILQKEPPSYIELAEINECTTTDKILWAINDLEAYKTAGDDGIFPALLQKGSDFLAPHLQALFRASLRLGYLPKTWRNTLVTFIPKPGKENYGHAGSYRPICLMSFILKTLEKLVDKRLRKVDIMNCPLEKSQHAYQPGKSTESALHDLIHHIDLALDNQMINYTVFIDISGAFDNTSVNTMIEHSENMGIAKWITDWIEMMLKNRRIKAKHESCTIKIIANKGCPQGGVLSPILWNIVVNSLNKTLKDDCGVHVTTFADDLAISVTGQNSLTICEKLNEAMKTVEHWCTRTGLSVNPGKTEMVRFTRRKTAGLKSIPIKLYDTVLHLSDEVKYLGVWLDNKLSMSSHITKSCNKAIRSLWQTKNMVDGIWGLNPKKVHWIYMQIIVPRITYGSIVTWKSVELKNIQDKLSSVQRTAMLLITGAMRTTATASLNAILNLQPLHIVIKTRAIACYDRLTMSDTWHDTHLTSKGHGSITKVANQIGNFNNNDRISDTWFTEQKYEVHINDAMHWDSDMHLLRDPIKIWTDGSIRDGKVGTGIYCPKLRLGISLRLSDHSNIMQAELTGLTESARLCAQKKVRNRNIIFCSDSQAALRAISRGTVKSHTALDCIQSMNELAEKHNTIHIYWIPGHKGHLGNELADEYAGRGTGKSAVDIVTKCTGRLRENSIARWSESETEKEWLKTGKPTHTKFFIPFPDNRAIELLKLSRKELRIYCNFITGHNCLLEHLNRIGKAENIACRQCMEGSIENSIHLICDCEALVSIRLKVFGEHFLTTDKLAELKPIKILNFIKMSQLVEIIAEPFLRRQN